MIGLKSLVLLLGLSAAAAGACPFCDQMFADSAQGRADRQTAMDRARSAFVARFKDADVQSLTTSRSAAASAGDLSRSATYYPAAAEEGGTRAGRPGTNLPPDL